MWFKPDKEENKESKEPKKASWFDRLIGRVPGEAEAENPPESPSVLEESMPEIPLEPLPSEEETQVEPEESMPEIPLEPLPTEEEIQIEPEEAMPEAPLEPLPAEEELQVEPEETVPEVPVEPLPTEEELQVEPEETAEVASENEDALEVSEPSISEAVEAIEEALPEGVEPEPPLIVEAEEPEEPEVVEPVAETAPEEIVAEAPKEKGFWGKTWDILNKPIFTIDDSWVGDLQERISKTRDEFVGKMQQIVRRYSKIDEDLLEELEELLLEADVGVGVTEEAIDFLRKQAKAGLLAPDGVIDALSGFMLEKLGETSPISLVPGKLNIVMVVGVNGTGKTTTIGKLASRFKIEGYSPIIGAADTFRAAAIDQLEVWGERAGVAVIRHHEGGDAAAVVFDSIKAAQARGADVLLIDTAGRLHNKANLMSELEKIRRIVDREAPDANKEVLIVLDATTGQNGLKQAEVFKKAVNLSGAILTKLDGTAKGGVVFAIRQELGIPVKVVGLGEKLEDLKDFNPKVFVEALFQEREDTL